MINILIAIFAALLPVGLLIFYICRKDKDAPEPVSWLVKAGLLGVAAALMSVLFGMLHPDFIAIFSSLRGTIMGAVGEALFDAAIPEEAFKLLMMWLLIRKNPFFNEHLDGIVYATCIGLGFAGLENIFYLIGNLDSIVSIALMRAIFSVPGHFFFAVIMGYFVSLACFGNISNNLKRRYWILAFAVPVVAHFIFDALLMSVDSAPGIFWLLFLLFIAFNIRLRKFGIRKIAVMKEKDKELGDKIFTTAKTVTSEPIPIVFHAVFIDDKNTVYHYYNGDLSLYRTDNLDSPFTADHVGTFQVFLSTIKRSVDGNEKIYIYHNSGASNVRQFVGCDPDVIWPGIVFEAHSFPEVDILDKMMGRVTPDSDNLEAFSRRLIEISMELQ